MRDINDQYLIEGFSLDFVQMKDAPDAMKLYTEVCMMLSPFYYGPAFGTLLGLYRDGGFIPHDTDHDFNVYCKDADEAKKLRGDVQEIFLLNGYELLLRDTFQLVFRKTGSSGLLIDLCFFFRHRDGWWCPHQVKDFKLPYKASHDPIVFLEAIYGDWETPRMKDEPYLA